MNIPDISSLKSRAGGAKSKFKKTVSLLKKMKGKEVDSRFHALHEEAFSEYDCLKCANCCKTTSPIFRDKDIARLAKHFKMKPGGFVERYLRQDEEGDYVFTSAPCPFLGADNYCSVYSVRLDACREYPHTNRKKMNEILDLTLRNTEVCPAVFGIMEKLSRIAEK